MIQPKPSSGPHPRPHVAASRFCFKERSCFTRFSTVPAGVTHKIRATWVPCSQSHLDRWVLFGGPSCRIFSQWCGGMGGCGFPGGPTAPLTSRELQRPKPPCNAMQHLWLKMLCRGNRQPIHLGLSRKLRMSGDLRLELMSEFFRDTFSDPLSDMTIASEK